MEDKKNPATVYRDRLIGLQGCAKAIHNEGQTPEETAVAAIRLLDLLEADAMRAAGLTRPTEPPAVPKVEDLRAAVAKLVSDNRLDRQQVELWMEPFFPEVRDGGIDGLTADHAAYVLGRPEAFLGAFRASTVAPRAGVGREDTCSPRKLNLEPTHAARHQLRTAGP